MFLQQKVEIRQHRSTRRFHNTGNPRPKEKRIGKNVVNKFLDFEVGVKVSWNELKFVSNKE